MQTKLVDITPDISLLPKLGYTGYTFTQALSEFIDNAIDASRDSSEINVRIKISPKKITVYDSGPGMTPSELSKAMTLAYSKKESQIGRFGMGLKTAALSMGSTFTVTTISHQTMQWSSVTFDESKWLTTKQGKWEIGIKSNQVGPEAQSFTRITITNPKIQNLKNFEKLKQDISLRYAPYIKSNMLTIWINDERCISPKLKIVKGSKKDFRLPMQGYSSLLNQFSENDCIRGWYALTEDARRGSFYGFNLYWQNRLISEYSKTGIDECVANSRIMGEIHLDFLDVTHNKREFIIESEKYKIVERVLQKFFIPLTTAAEMLSDEESLRKALTLETSDWLKKLAKAFKKSQELKDLTLLSDLGVGFGFRDEYINDGEEVNMGEPIPRTDSPGELPEDKSRKSVDPDATTPDDDEEKKPKEKNKQSPKPKDKFKISIKGKKFEFTHKFVTLGRKGSWKRHLINEQSGIVEIYTNTDFPAFSATTDKPFYAVMNIVDSLAIVFIETFGTSDYSQEEIKEVILRETCTISL